MTSTLFTLAAPSSARRGHPCSPHAPMRTIVVRSARKPAADLRRRLEQLMEGK